MKFFFIGITIILGCSQSPPLSHSETFDLLSRARFSAMWISPRDIPISRDIEEAQGRQLLKSFALLVPIDVSGEDWKPMWTIGFQTGKSPLCIEIKIEEEIVTIYYEGKFFHGPTTKQLNLITDYISRESEKSVFSKDAAF